MGDFPSCLRLHCVVIKYGDLRNIWAKYSESWLEDANVKYWKGILCQIMPIY